MSFADMRLGNHRLRGDFPFVLQGVSDILVRAAADGLAHGLFYQFRASAA